MEQPSVHGEDLKAEGPGESRGYVDLSSGGIGGDDERRGVQWHSIGIWVADIALAIEIVGHDVGELHARSTAIERKGGIAEVAGRAHAVGASDEAGQMVDNHPTDIDPAIGRKEEIVVLGKGSDPYAFGHEVCGLQ